MQNHHLKIIYPYVNGIPATKSADGTTGYVSPGGGQPGTFGPQTGNITTTVYDYYMAKGFDPTEECDYVALTDEDPDKITRNLDLMTSLANGATVSWSSSDPEVISSNGTVTRKTYDEKVTLTACITFNGISLYKRFNFIVTASDKDIINLILDSEDFSSAVPHLVTNVPLGSVCEIKEGKLTLTRESAGTLSVEKYFVKNLSYNPYVVEGDKIITEQYISYSGEAESATAILYNKNGEVAVTYGFKIENGENVFFVNAGGEDVTMPYSEGQELFVRLEMSTTSGKLNVLVDNEVLTTASIDVANHASISSVKYEVGEGTNGCMTIDNIMLMVETDDHDAVRLALDYANLSEKDLTSQNPDMITENLIFPVTSSLGCSLAFESLDKNVVSDDGIVTRQNEDKTVTIRATVTIGNNSLSKDITVVIKGATAGNLSVGNLALSSGAVEGYPEKNAVDDIPETEFRTGTASKYLIICFKQPTTFNKVTLMEAKNELDEYGITGFNVDVSDDSSEWTTVYTGTTIGERKTFKFNEVTAKYIRYNVIGLNGTETGLREFAVMYEPEAETAIKLDVAELKIYPESYAVTEDLTLPVTTKYGSSVTWKSSNTDLISNDGRIVGFPKKDTIVKITATLTNGAYIKTKDFTRLVKGTSTGNEGGGGAGGGGSDSKPSKIEGEIIAPNTENKPVIQNIFSDVENDRWSYDFIKELKDSGIVAGDGENFRPTDSVTREEFVKMLVLSVGFAPEGTADFNDVSSDAWYHDYIAIAVEKGIVNGVSNEYFGVGTPISRQDMAVMTVRALEVLGVDLPTDRGPVYLDEYDISIYAADSVDILSVMNVLNGSDGKFSPKANLTREQAAKVLCLIRKELTK